MHTHHILQTHSSSRVVLLKLNSLGRSVACATPSGNSGESSRLSLFSLTLRLSGVLCCGSILEGRLVNCGADVGLCVGWCGGVNQGEEERVKNNNKKNKRIKRDKRNTKE